MTKIIQNPDINHAMNRGVKAALKGRYKNPYTQPHLKDAYEAGWNSVPEANRGKEK